MPKMPPRILALDIDDTFTFNIGPDENKSFDVTRIDRLRSSYQIQEDADVDKGDVILTSNEDLFLGEKKKYLIKALPTLLKSLNDFAATGGEIAIVSARNLAGQMSAVRLLVSAAEERKIDISAIKKFTVVHTRGVLEDSFTQNIPFNTKAEMKSTDGVIYHRIRIDALAVKQSAKAVTKDDQLAALAKLMTTQKKMTSKEEILMLDDSHIIVATALRNGYSASVISFDPEVPVYEAQVLPVSFCLADAVTDVNRKYQAYLASTSPAVSASHLASPAVSSVALEENKPAARAADRFFMPIISPQEYIKSLSGRVAPELKDIRSSLVNVGLKEQIENSTMGIILFAAHNPARRDEVAGVLLDLIVTQRSNPNLLKSYLINYHFELDASIKSPALR